MGYRESISQLDLYLKEIGQYSLLTKEEEQILGYRILQGDTDAVQKLFYANLRFAAKLAIKMYYRMHGHKLDVFDYINEGNTGLYEACQKFDIRKNTNFTTFAAYYIKRNILGLINFCDREYKVYGQLYSNFKMFVSKKNELELQYGRVLSYNELAKELNWSVQSVMAYYVLLEENASLDAPIDDKSTLELVDSVADEAQDIETIVENAIINAGLHEIMKEVLSPKELDVIEKRYGFHGEKMTLEQISISYNATRQWISSIEKRALDKLRNAIEKRHLIDSPKLTLS